MTEAEQFDQYYEQALAELTKTPSQHWFGADDGGYDPDAMPGGPPNVSKAEAEFDGPGILLSHHPA